MPLQDVIAGVVGLAIGLIIANLLGGTFVSIPVIGNYPPVLFSIVLVIWAFILLYASKGIGELLAE